MQDVQEPEASQHSDLLLRFQALFDDFQAKAQSTVEAIDALKKERENFEKDVMAAISYPIEGERIRINVGGTLFETTKKTLQQTPRGSVFYAIASGMVENNDGVFFLDRPAKPFSIILTALQVGSFYKPEKQRTLSLVSSEIHFYGLEEMDLFNSIFVRLKNNTIIPEDHVRTVCNWIPASLQIVSWQLLFRLTRDGSSKFAPLCRHKGPLLIVLKGRDGSIFGGFASNYSPAKSGVYTDDRNAFLFVLYRDGWVEEKLECLTQTKVIYHDRGAIAFGSSDLEFDDFENAYSNPSTFARLADGTGVCPSSISLAEIEVFGR